MGSTKRPDGNGPEPGLFDLPLVDSRRRGDELQAAPAAAASATAAGAGNLPLFAPGAAAAPRPLAAPRAGVRAEAPLAPLAARLVAGLADLAVHAALLAAAVFGARLLGVERTPPWPPLLLLGLAFSFVYSVVPLAFWGQTPGMAWRGIQARSPGGEPLSFEQTVRRWLGSLVTAALAGLPLLVTRAGLSLSDRLSGSETRATPRQRSTDSPPR
jgi:uncharacterized RDD family membrane protein YckC